MNKHPNLPHTRNTAPFKQCVVVSFAMNRLYGCLYERYKKRFPQPRKKDETVALV